MGMTKLMEMAIERLRTVPESEQDDLARFLLNELEEEHRWLDSTSRHENKLQDFVGQVLADDDRGACEPLEPDKL